MKKKSVVVFSKFNTVGKSQAWLTKKRKSNNKNQQCLKRNKGYHKKR